MKLIVVVEAKPEDVSRWLDRIYDGEALGDPPPSPLDGFRDMAGEWVHAFEDELPRDLPLTKRWEVVEE